MSERNVTARNQKTSKSQELLEEKRIALAKPKIGTTTGNLLRANDSTIWSFAGKWIEWSDRIILVFLVRNPDSLG